MRKLALCAAVAATAFAALPAQATKLYGRITGYAMDLRFEIDTAPAVCFSDLSFGFGVCGLPGSVDGFVSFADLTFYNAIGGPDGNGGMRYANGGPGLYYGSGLVVFGGTEAAPTFTAGSWSLSTLGGFGVPYTTKLILSTTPAVPEPASWALMITGIGVAGAMIRRRRIGVAYRAA